MEAISNQSALITGASSGIGEFVALELARLGYGVGLFARRKDELGRAAARIEKAGGKALVLPGDVTRAGDLKDAAAKLEAALGPVEVLVANAGVGVSGKSFQPGGENAVRTIEINLIGAVHAIDAVLAGMVERGRGRIAGVSSLAGWRGLPGSAPYSASKAGLSAYLETLRVDLKKRGISVTTVHPGFVRTPLTAKNKNPMPFLVGAEEAAKTIVEGILRERPEVNFPAPLAAIMRFVRHLPDFLYDPLMRKAGGPG